MYKKGQAFKLTKDVKIQCNVFPKNSVVQIFSVIENSCTPYNILFKEKDVIHTAMKESFINENAVPIQL